MPLRKKVKSIIFIFHLDISIYYMQPGVVAHAFNSSTQESETSRSLSLKPAWSTEQVIGHLGLERGKKAT